MLSSPPVDLRSLSLPSGVEILISPSVFQLLAPRCVILLPDCSIPPSRRQNRHSPRRLQVRCLTSIEDSAARTAAQPSADLGKAELTPKADSARGLGGGSIRPSTAQSNPARRNVTRHAGAVSLSLDDSADSAGQECPLSGKKCANLRET